MTPLEAIGPDIALTNWERRLLNRGTLSSFGSADGTFGDVVSATGNRAFETYSFDELLWAYDVILNDTRTPLAVLVCILGPLTDAFVASLKSTFEKQEMGELGRYMGAYSRARGTGRFDDVSVAHIGRVMEVMAENFSAKVNYRKPDYTPRPPPRDPPSSDKGGPYGKTSKRA